MVEADGISPQLFRRDRDQRINGKDAERAELLEQQPKFTSQSQHPGAFSHARRRLLECGLIYDNVRNSLYKLLPH